MTRYYSLLTIDSETGTGIAIFQFSSEMVFSLAKIQPANDVQIPQNNLNVYSPDEMYICIYVYMYIRIYVRVCVRVRGEHV